MISMFIKRFRTIYFDEHGIWFYYKGDEVCWKWWWRRNLVHGYCKFLSSLTEGQYNSLKEMDRFWEQYQNHCAYEEGEL